MPELPEVEVTRRGVEPLIVGQTIRAVRLGKPLRWPLQCVPEALTGRRITAVDRRAKYLLVHLDTGMLLVHLGMSGSLRFWSEPPDPGVHDHFDLLLDHGVLRLHDPRRFGAVVWLDSLEAPWARKLLGGWGVEPLSADFTPAVLLQGLRNSRTSVKELLLSGSVVVGVGNIYVCEALFMAGIRPTRRADRIGAAKALRLHSAIQDVLQKALVAGGSSLRDFAGVDGAAGHFQTQTQVYGRAGAPCRICGTPISVVRQAQRSTYFCRCCQR